MATTKVYRNGESMDIPSGDASYWAGQGWSTTSPAANPSATAPTAQPSTPTTQQNTSTQKATIWNPNTGEKRVVTVGEPTPAGFSLWTGGTATGSQAQASIRANMERQGANINPSEGVSGTVPSGYTGAGTWDSLLSSATPLQQGISAYLQQQSEESARLAEEYRTQMIEAQKSLNSAISDTTLTDSYKKYQADTAQRRTDLTNTLNELNTLNTQMNTEIANMKQTGELGVLVQGRIQVKQEEYAARISGLSAKAKILQDDIAGARDDFNTYYTVASNQRAEQLNNLNKMFEYASDGYFKLRSEEKEAISNQINYLNQIETQQQETKKSLLDLMTKYPTAFAKGKVLPTDTIEQAMSKIQPYMTAEQDRDTVMSLIQKYGDAGILPTDSLATASSKIKNSKIYQKETAGYFTVDAYGNMYNTQTGEYVNSGTNGNPMVQDSADQIDSFMLALSGQESGSTTGNYNARNNRTNAYGRFQIMPSNWPSWSREYAANVLGKSVSKLPETPANQDAVAKYKMQQYFNQYGNWADVASMWYSGRPLSQVKAEGWADRKQGNGNEPSVNEYVKSVLSKMGVSQTTSTKVKLKTAQKQQLDVIKAATGVDLTKYPPEIQVLFSDSAYQGVGIKFGNAMKANPNQDPMALANKLITESLSGSSLLTSLLSGGSTPSFNPSQVPGT